METVLRVKLALLPLALFVLVLPAAGIGAAAAAGLAGSVGLWLWRRRAGEVMQAEIAALLFFAAALIGGGLLGLGGARIWIALLKATMAGVSFLSLARGRPWTADYARKAFAAEADTPAFHAINRLLTGLWGVLFAAMALAIALEAPRAVVAGLVLVGLGVSIAGPRLLIRRAAARMLKRERFDWPAPALLPAREDVDVAIIGAGIGGLTAAALLARAGARVAVHEQHVVPGGFAHSFLRKAHHQGRPLVFRFDGGVHDVSGVRPGGPVTALLERIGAPPIDWLRLDHRFVRGNHVYDVPRDIDAHVAALGRLYPDSAAGLVALFADIRTVFDAMYSQAPKASGVPGPPADVDALLAFPKQHPLAMAWLERPFLAFVRRHVTDPQAIAMLFGLAGYVTDDAANLPVRAMVPLYGYGFFGGFYPRGGSGRLAEALVAPIEAAGGRVEVKSAVTGVLIEKGEACGIGLADGRTLRAGAVISNADLKRTYLDLVGQDRLPPAFAAEIAALEPACSAVAVHLGLAGVPDLPPVIHVEGAAGSAGLVLPSLVDADAAPAGHATLEIMRLVPHREARDWFATDADLDQARRRPDYRARKALTGDSLIAAAEQALPDLRDRIIFRADASPITYARYDHTSAGSIYGVAGFEGRSAKSPVPGLVIAGAATHGPGIEAVMISGARAAEALVPGLLRTP